MPRFILNQNQQPNGDNEVHNTTTGCHKMPALENQIHLGDYPSCHGAVAHAKAQYRNARINGCVHCCTTCHTT
jgi:hypothetical protein